MCGIGGVFGFNDVMVSESEDYILQEMFVRLESRGTDAFGYYTKHTGLIKMPLPAHEAQDILKTFHRVPMLYTGETEVLGHTRAYTTGHPLNNKNNHPFEGKRFVMAHNGVVYDYQWIYDILDKSKYSDIPETDSYSILAYLEYVIDEIDVIDGLSETIDMFTDLSIMALWIYDKKEDTLYLYRDYNPLSYYVDKDSEKLWFVSEAHMLPFEMKQLKPGTLLVAHRDGEIDLYELDVHIRPYYSSYRSRGNPKYRYYYDPEYDEWFYEKYSNKYNYEDEFDDFDDDAEYRRELLREFFGVTDDDDDDSYDSCSPVCSR